MSVIFEKASVLCYRMFDIANEIHFEQLQSILVEGTQRMRFTREGSQYIQLPNPPIGLELPPQTLKLKGQELQVEAKARLFDHGAASVVLRVPLQSGMTLEQLVVLADELYDSAAVEKLAAELVEGIRRQVSVALEGSHLWGQSESYTIVFAEQIAGNPTGQEVLEQADLARLLLGEVNVRALSARQKRDVTQAQFSYSEDDLVVVDWNAAFVYEPSGSMDVPDILEVCNAQLLELRYYDDVLDGHIRSTYDALKGPRRRWPAIISSPYRTLLHRLQVTLLEMDEFTERVDNSLKIIGDFYLAKVYEAAVGRLRIPSWQAAVTRKQQMLGNVYQLLKGEVDTARSLALEFFVVGLIGLELLLAGLKIFR